MRWERAAGLTACIMCLGLLILEWIVGAGNAEAAHRPVDLSLFAITAGNLLATLVLVAVGTAILFRYSRQPIGWIMIALGLSWGLSVVAPDYGRYALITHPQFLPAGHLAASLSIWMYMVNLLLFFWLVMLFPDGRLSGLWRLIFWVGTGFIALEGVFQALAPGPSNVPGVANPIGIVQVPGLIGDVAGAIALASMPAAAVAALRRFLTSSGVERQQIKWFAYGAVFAMVMTVVAIFMGFSGIVAALDVAALTLVPLTVGVAILRYRLYDIDVLINRTLVYGLLTVSLGLVYIAGVIALQALFRALTGQGSNVAIAISTLAIAALFQPLRRGIQDFIDRRFYRRKYDATRTLAAFNARLREDVDLEGVTGEILMVVQETMQPAHVSLWLRQMEREGVTK